ncbi:MAG: radical SAM protein [Planctomycetes bacterium]|nr:radical SAM protein [Planctomycetota bacterium]
MTSLVSRLLCATIGTAYDASLRDFPNVVRIESTNACNAQCIICPHHRMSRPIERIERSLCERIIKECAENQCREIHLHNFGEPFLDTRLETFVKYAKDRGVEKVKVFSNGAIISEERARGVLQAGIDEIKISFDGATEEEFERIRTPLKFGAVVANTVRLVELRDELASPARIKVACCSTTDKSQTMGMLAAKVDGFSFGKIHNWGGDGGEQKQSAVRKPCSRLWRTFTILADGNVSLCCLDYNGVVTLGNVSKDSIKDIWGSRQYKSIRALHQTARQEEIALCAHCSKAFL